jgi:hypothetical protein
MSATHSFDFSDFDFWSLPYEKYGLFVDQDADKYGIAAAVVREALRGEGKQGARKKRLAAALACGDEKTICAEIAGIYRSAVQNSYAAKSKNCIASNSYFEKGYHEASTEQDEIFEFIRELKDEMDYGLSGKIEVQKKILQIYLDKHMLFSERVWIEICEVLGLSSEDFARIKRIAAVDETPIPVKLDGRQLAFDFAAA